jgi:hypothetical protein
VNARPAARGVVVAVAAVLATLRIRAGTCGIRCANAAHRLPRSWSKIGMRLPSVTRIRTWVVGCVERLWSQPAPRRSASEIAGVAVDVVRSGRGRHRERRLSPPTQRPPTPRQAAIRAARPRETARNRRERLGSFVSKNRQVLVEKMLFRVVGLPPSPLFRVPAPSEEK